MVSVYRGRFPVSQRTADLLNWCVGAGPSAPRCNMQSGFKRVNSLSKRLDILIVENDPAMARLTKEAFKEAGLHEGVRSVELGEQALAYLRRREHSPEHPHPDLIFLDLHLPKQSGLEVLEEIKADPLLCVIPVVIVSGSENPQDVRRAYELHASCFVRKPSDLNEFLDFIRICYEFWGSVVTLPGKETM